MNERICVFLLLLSCTLFSCKKNNNQRAFYFWRTTAHLSSEEKQSLTTLNIQKLYVRFFDVDINEETGQAMPKGPLQNLDSLGFQREIVPIIYITNRTLLQTPEAAIKSLANHIYSKINTIASNSKTAYGELQIDCDWSDKTRAKYFQLLREIKAEMPEKKALSATIRLHQIKYYSRTGIPPVDKGMLMFYNMGNVTLKDGSNSIFNKGDAEKYAPFLQKYPLNLDVALPIFQWAVVFQEHKTKQILSKKDMPDITDTAHFFSKDNYHFVAKTGFFQKGFYFKENDEIKIEQLSFEALNEAATLLKQNIKDTSRTIILFDLDEFNIHYYGTQHLEKIYHSFN
jgi:hypothetical protein